MVFWIASLAGLAVAYLLGSFPTGYIAGRLFRGVDIRDLGSGSTGATNVLRTLGPWAGAAVLLIDVLKGVAAIAVARTLWSWLEAQPSVTFVDLPSALPWAVCLAGLAALIGHARPVWLGFRGGKSVATGLGVLLAMSWPVGVGGLAVFAVAVAVFRMVSLGSILAALTAVGVVCALDHPLPYRLMVIAGGAYVVFLHRANIRRLLAGTEPRLGRRS
ncbi:glycerol-3-phosphate 1-O-acyltransferase PlsY [Phenylobacterium sp.]|uniref:glycerol-3-phosphate 1-O-acyltransferase PlsY n=1 Tax=Phenylobacterium sp. TaxID=1871053 RepID=UPI0025D794EA|nr:glycerol-3-phosphate 1-O-acyltransferase PlsY [Phenylobacterium sp.]MBX3484240.1 glycerol-3-phosphate 1-O-acyltransferase PlsY [Phenylobacterium sp.]MCW5760220.1 glycerol-3-phosphate 1-O-acyltransferase PlsY [Phenylobacterium sp.]